VGSDVRIAVVWLTQSGGYSVSEDLPVQPVFPSSFVIQLTSPPPAAAIVSQGGAQLAAGVVVAYEDLNGDGMLDLVPSDAGSFIDKIVGANPDVYVAYISGPVPADATGNGVLGAPSSGYNLLQSGTCQATMPGGATPDADAGAGPDSGNCAPAWLPIDTPYDMTLTSNPQVNEIMCQGYGQMGSGSTGAGSSGAWDVAQQGAPIGGYPAPGAPGLVCDGATSYAYSPACVEQQTSLCTSIEVCQSTSTVELGGAAPPAGWPCP
jgi:hypothetical protein